MSIVKTSYGIALCQYNAQKNNVVEILLIKKRYSYQYFSFVFGHYKKGDTKYIKYLFDNMSFSEKIDILGMQFGNMWYRIWLNNPEKHFNIRDIYDADANKNLHKISNSDIYKLFFNKQSKFKNNFGNDMGGKLRNLIQQSTDAEILWEIPKGGKKDGETNIDCAMREFGEETSIRNTKYCVLYNVEPAVETYIDNNTTYKNVYYLAVSKQDSNFIPKINFKNFEQISEVEQIKWVSINEIRFMNLPQKTHAKLIDLYSRVITKFKKSQKIKICVK